ncbi:MAG TPA: SMC-Scp complex subunit ScpB [Clostridia bacterium]|nr:SMC-Scp complex subunit ScpB [Clostridia bacterium]
MKPEAIIEVLLFASGDPLEFDELVRASGLTAVEVNKALESLAEKYGEESGIRLLRFGSKLQLSTAPGAAQYVEDLLYPIQKKSLSKAALEVLSIIAYKQPITRSEIEVIRGVQCDKTVINLQNMGLIKEVGRKSSLGRPILYGVTDEFLAQFGLSSIDDLPKRDIKALTPEDNQINL